MFGDSSDLSGDCSQSFIEGELATTIGALLDLLDNF